MEASSSKSSATDESAAGIGIGSEGEKDTTVQVDTRTMVDWRIHCIVDDSNPRKINVGGMQEGIRANGGVLIPDRNDPTINVWAVMLERETELVDVEAVRNGEDANLDYTAPGKIFKHGAEYSEAEGCWFQAKDASARVISAEVIRDLSQGRLVKIPRLGYRTPAPPPTPAQILTRQPIFPFCRPRPNSGNESQPSINPAANTLPRIMINSPVNQRARQVDRTTQTDVGADTIARAAFLRRADSLFNAEEDVRARLRGLQRDARQRAEADRQFDRIVHKSRISEAAQKIIDAVLPEKIDHPTLIDLDEHAKLLELAFRSAGEPGRWRSLDGVDLIPRPAPRFRAALVERNLRVYLDPRLDPAIDYLCAIADIPLAASPDQAQICVFVTNLYEDGDKSGQVDSGSIEAYQVALAAMSADGGEMATDWWILRNLVEDKFVDPREYKVGLDAQTGRGD